MADDPGSSDKRVDLIESDARELEQRMRAIEVEQAVTNQVLAELRGAIGSIKQDTRWLVRLVVSSIASFILALLGFVAAPWISSWVSESITR